MKRELGVGIPRGRSHRPALTPQVGLRHERFTVRNVFLDGTEPTELLDKVAGSPPHHADADRRRTGAHRSGRAFFSHQDEELVHARAMVTRYAKGSKP